MNQRQDTPRTNGGTSLITTMLQFLGSMNLAITLLIVLAIASVSGTILQQNQPYPDYLEQFGPFWFDIFRRLGLFDVYSAGWFLAILAALLLSTSVCLCRRAPGMLQQMNRYREHHQVRSLRALAHHREWSVPMAAADTAAIAADVLRHQGYRTRLRPRGEARLLAGLAGRSNRLGYVALHLAIVVIAIGGLMDANLSLKFREWRGDVVTETRALPISELRSESRLPAGRDAFRGIVTIPEGERASVAFLQLRDGYVVRELPFELRLEAFRVLRYASGEARAYESDVVLNAPDLDEPLRRTIRVNEPLQYGGYTIFQAGFGDGGSDLNLTAWPLAGNPRQPLELDLRTFREQGLSIDGQQYQLQITDFEAHNVQPDGIDGTGRTKVRDVGPRVRYQIRDRSGNQQEFESYMLPMTLEGQPYFVTGVRAPDSADFRYLHIPADQHYSPARFTALASQLGDPERRAEIAGQAVHTLLGDAAEDYPVSTAHLTRLTAELLAALAEGGQQSMHHLLRERGEAPDQASPPAGLLERGVDEAMIAAYRQALAESGDDPERSLDANDSEFLRHSMATIPALERFGAPVFLELNGFDLRQASTLEITRSPGKPVVYAGFLLLSLGLFLTFFVTYRRSWCWIQPREDGATQVLLAGTSARDNPGQAEHFQTLAARLETRLQAARQSPQRTDSENPA